MQPLPRELKLTYDDLRHLPEDGRRHELIDGEHVMTPAPNLRHQQISMRMAAALHTWVEARQLGWVLCAPVDVRLSEFDVVEPDLVFVAVANRSRLTDEAIDGAPDLVVEIVSESSRRRDEVEKRKLYDRAGVAEYLIVDPVVDRVQVLRRDPNGRLARVAELAADGDEPLGTPLLSGFALALADLFRR